MGKFPLADKALASVSICKKCKIRNHRHAEKCRKCNYPHLRPKRQRRKEAKGGGK